MNLRLCCAVLATGVIARWSPAQEIQRLDPAANAIIPKNARVERVVTGFDKWTEGPVWTRDGSLLFAEIPANNIVRWHPGEKASVFIHPSGYTGSVPYNGPEPGSNGMTLDAQGKETRRDRLRPGGGQVRIAPAVDPNAAPRGTGAAPAAGRGGPGRGGPVVTLPIAPANTAIRPGDWNDVEILLDANLLRFWVNNGTNGAVADDEIGSYGPIALYAGGSGAVSFRHVACKDINVMVRSAEQPAIPTAISSRAVYMGCRTQAYGPRWISSLFGAAASPAAVSRSPRGGERRPICTTTGDHCAPSVRCAHTISTTPATSVSRAPHRSGSHMVCTSNGRTAAKSLVVMSYNDVCSSACRFFEVICGKMVWVLRHYRIVSRRGISK